MISSKNTSKLAADLAKLSKLSSSPSALAEGVLTAVEDLEMCAMAMAARIASDTSLTEQARMDLFNQFFDTNQELIDNVRERALIAVRFLGSSDTLQA